ncbi:hypothetical protein B0H34DRAFT_526740 [Crassisporium funariophilum]|nr:hypothetical protein B0H34DRAFT_526740 [Crassisporium funariophilum]
MPSWTRRTQQPTLKLTTFPEELLERILEECVVASTTQASRPSWHQANNSTTLIRGRLAPLLVCRLFFRICTPLFYHTVHITSPGQLHSLLSGTLRPNPYLAAHIRRLIFAGAWAQGGELLRLCRHGLKTLDLTLDAPQLAPSVHGNVRDLDAEEFCEGLKAISRSVTHIVLRKSNNVYLTQAKPRFVLMEVAKAIQYWDQLEIADIAFRLSDDSGSLSIHPGLPLPARASPARPGPITALTHSLSTRPKLHTFTTVLPSLWNETILRISANPALERIIMVDGSGANAHREAMPNLMYGHGQSHQGHGHGHSRGTSLGGKDLYPSYGGGVSPMAPLEGGHGIMGTGIFFMQAKKHARLSELIRAGTSIMRSRAHTMGVPPPSSPYSYHNQAMHGAPPPQASSAPAQRAIYPRSQSMIPTSGMSSVYDSSPASPTSPTSSRHGHHNQKHAAGQSPSRRYPKFGFDSSSASGSGSGCANSSRPIL